MSRIDDLRQRNLFQELLDLRDQQRQDLGQALAVIKGREIPIESNPLGRMQWYLHPAVKDTAIQSLIVAVTEIRPGEATGKLLQQGGTVIFFLSGRGRTVLDGDVYDWKAEDLINVPLRPDGVTIQHFNTGSEVARFVEAGPNLVHALGVDRGSGFEVLEPASAGVSVSRQNGS